VETLTVAASTDLSVHLEVTRSVPASHNPVSIIAKKRDGGELTPAEIAAFIRGYVAGDIPDYQMSALAMAIYLRGMYAEETACLTKEMLRSGATLPRSESKQPRIDKHSTGGVGDKSSIVLAPLLACCNVEVPMIAGRGLGATGGTLDKLESIPGFRTDLSTDELQRVVADVSCAITGATADIAPADRKLYALRDVTATVASIPLITASILSKKLAENLDALVLDVKFGSGAFMKTLPQANALARSLVDTASSLGVQAVALVTDMNQPTGRMAGCAVEINECLDVLNGAGPADLRELILALGADVLAMSGRYRTPEEATVELQSHLQSGRALERLHKMVVAQGGDLGAPLKVAPEHVLIAEYAGVVQRIETESLGLAIVALGGGRRVITDRVDHSVGLEVLVRVGDEVAAGQPLLRVFAPAAKRASVQEQLRQAVVIDDEPTEPLMLIVDRVV